LFLSYCKTFKDVEILENFSYIYAHSLLVDSWRFLKVFSVLALCNLKFSLNISISERTFVRSVVIISYISSMSPFFYTRFKIFSNSSLLAFLNTSCSTPNLNSSSSVRILSRTSYVSLLKVTKLSLCWEKLFTSSTNSSESILLLRRSTISSIPDFSTLFSRESIIKVKAVWSAFVSSCSKRLSMSA